VLDASKAVTTDHPKTDRITSQWRSSWSCYASWLLRVVYGQA